MSLISAVRDADRMRQITQVLVRHGFGELVCRMGLSTKSSADGQKVPRVRLGERIRLVLQDLGPSFVKLGQIISTRPDLVPEDIVTELKKLQDEVPPVSVEAARQQVVQCLERPVEQIFDSFESEPLASASVAQVHRATLGRPVGTEEETEQIPVVVKIQRPGIVSTVAKDLDLLYLFARIIERTVPESRVYSPTGLVREFDRAINAELDFTIEAENAARFAGNFRDDATIAFPDVFAEASGKQVLTLEFLDGLKVDQAVKQGADPAWIAENAVRIILKMVFEDGFFHADPHPGNVLILPRPEGDSYDTDQQLIIGLLDLGLVGRLSPELRDRSVDLLLAAARNDPDGIAEAMLAIGHPRTKVDREAFRNHVRQISQLHLGRPLKEIEVSSIVRDIVAGALKFEIEIPVELTMMLRALMTIEGVGKEIYPELDVFQVAKPYLTRIVWQRYHPSKLGAELLHGIEQLGKMARFMPGQLQEIIDDIRHGQLKIQTSDAKTADATDRLGKRLRGSIASATLLVCGTALFLGGKQQSLAWVLIGASAFVFIIHMLFDFFSRSRSD